MKAESDYYRLGGGIVQVDWEDRDLRAIMGRALAHRLVPAAAPALRIRALAGKHEWPASAPGALGVSDGAAGLVVIDATRRISHRVNAAGTEAEYVCEVPEQLQGHDRASPFNVILQHWLGLRQIRMLHGAAVGVPGHGAVLLAARSGGGKSNTMVACLDSPLHVLGEDYVAVDSAANPVIWALYNTAKLFPADMGRYPKLTDDVDPVRDVIDDKVVLQLAARHVARWTDGLPLRAIFVLKVTGRPETRIVPAMALDAVKELLTSPLMLLPQNRRPLFEFVTRLTGTLPVYRLELGTNRPQIGLVIHEFLTRPKP